MSASTSWMAWYQGGPMEQLVRRFRSRERGSALTEYGLIVAAVALGLIAVLTGFRNAVGDVTARTSVSISNKSSKGFGYGSSGGVRPAGGNPAPQAPPEPEPEGGDSTGVAGSSGQDAAAGY
jgi:Flp pilus assembly pilin Flp